MVAIESDDRKPQKEALREAEAITKRDMREIVVLVKHDNHVIV
ncbi:MAG: hypothetical protein HW384_2303 [Dehalococcoidia bacterium]|nr:hypothetical protein [Dehalococcoidia bacterium]